MCTELNLSGMRPTSRDYPDYPSLKFESNRTVVQEAFINGQYLGAAPVRDGPPEAEMVDLAGLYGPARCGAAPRGAQ